MQSCIKEWRTLNGHSFQPFLGAFRWQVRWAPAVGFFSMQACFCQRRAMPFRVLLSETESETSSASRDESALTM